MGRFAWLCSMIGARFNADVHNQRRLAEHLGRTPRETWERFAAVVDSRVEPARVTWAWMGEVIVHATDAPFRQGQGPRLEGPVLDLLMVMAGRPVFPEHLIGPGVSTLREPLAF